MWHCSHSKKHLITETDYRGYPEKIYSCQYCGAIIAVPSEHIEIRSEERRTEVGTVFAAQASN